MPVQEWSLTAQGWKTPLSPEALISRDFLVYGEYVPSASTTGYTGSLTPSGGITTTTDGQVIENLDINGRVIVNHSGVTIRNCHIRSSQPPPPSTTPWPALQAWSATESVTRVIDCEIESSLYPVVGSTEAVAGMDTIIERCNIHDAADGIKGNYGNVEIYGCWIHDMKWYADDPNHDDGSHNDGIQLIGSNGQNSKGFIVRGNKIEMGTNGTSALICTQPSGYTVHSLVIDKNWFISTVPKANATAVGLNLAQKQIPVAFGPTTVTNNRFTAWDASDGTGNGWRVDHDALIDQQTYDAATISGNTWLDGVTPAKITRVTVV